MQSSIARIGFFAFIIWVPIPIASNRPIFWLANAAIGVTILVLLLSATSARRQLPTASRWIIAFLAASSLSVMSWMLIQAVPWTPEGLHHPAWTEFEIEAIPLSGAISANPSATLWAMLQFATVAIAGIIAARVSVTSRRSEQVLVAVIVSGLVVAVWGLAALTFDWPQTIISDAPRGRGSLTSFFVNRNTAAVFMGLGLVSTLALMNSRFRRWRPAPGWLPVLVDFPARAGVYLIVAVILSLALLGTASRAGVAAVAAGAVATFIVSWKRDGSKPMLVAVAILLVAGALMLFFGPTSDYLIERASELDFVNESRWIFYRDTLDAIADRPFLGHGAGAFADIYPLYRSPEAAPGLLLATHNTFLQAAAEIGIPAVLVVLGILAFLVTRCVQGARRDGDSLAAPAAAVAATVVVGVHAMFEFSIQIQAVAIAYAAILGAGFAISSIRPAGASSRKTALAPA